MKSKLALGLVLLVSALTLTWVHATEKEDFHEGFEYSRVIPPQPTTAGKGQVEVVEVFWYGCPHCYRFEPHLVKWLKTKPKHVKFVRIPASFQPLWALHARAYYAAQKLKLGDKFHAAFFHEIHESKNYLDTKDKLIAFFGKHGVSKAKFVKVFDSKEITKKLAADKELIENYRIDGVPTVIIHGKYRASTRVLDSNDPKFLRLVDFLIKKEKTEQDGAKKAK